MRSVVVPCLSHGSPRERLKVAGHYHCDRCLDYSTPYMRHFKCPMNTDRIFNASKLQVPGYCCLFVRGQAETRMSGSPPERKVTITCRIKLLRLLFQPTYLICLMIAGFLVTHHFSSLHQVSTAASYVCLWHRHGLPIKLTFLSARKECLCGYDYHNTSLGDKHETQTHSNTIDLLPCVAGSCSSARHRHKLCPC